MIEEMLDLVDENDHVISVMPRSYVFAHNLTNFRLVSAFLRDTHGNFLIPRRTKYKSHYPDLFACVGGCVQTGETYDQACARELFEETGIVLHDTTYRTLGVLNPWQHDTKGYNTVYEVIIDPTRIDLNSDDFSEIICVSSTQLPAQLTVKHVTHNFPILLKHFYGIILP